MTCFMRMLLAVLCVVLLSAQAFAKSNYEKLLDKSPQFKKLDSELNAVFKGIVGKASPGDRRMLQAEQYWWIVKEFDDAVAKTIEGVEQKSDAETASMHVLQARIDNLKKLEVKDTSTKLLGLPVTFGMTRTAVHNALDKNSFQEDGTYKIEFMGNEADVTFHFSNVVFECDSSQKEDFRRFLDSINVMFGADLAIDPNPKAQSKIYSTKLERLIGVSLSMKCAKDGGIDDSIYGSLKKKYKSIVSCDEGWGLVYKQVYRVDSIEAQPDEPRPDFYESADKYIALTIDFRGWSIVAGLVEVEYFDKDYINNHVSNRNLLGAFRNIRNFNKGYLFFKHGDSIRDVVAKLHGNVSVSIQDGALCGLGQSNSEDKGDPAENFRVSFDFRDGKLISLSPHCDFVDSFVENNKAKFDKAFKKADMNVVYDYLQGYFKWGNVWETEENVIMHYFIPHVGPNFEIIRKSILAEEAARRVKAIHDYKRRERENIDRDIDKL